MGYSRKSINHYDNNKYHIIYGVPYRLGYSVYDDHMLLINLKQN